MLSIREMRRGELHSMYNRFVRCTFYRFYPFRQFICRSYGTRKNAEEYASKRASDDKDRMAIKSSVGSWSDDFYPVSSKMFSNVQKMSLNISRDEIEKIRNQISIIFRCTGREYLEGTNHPFSFVLTIEQKHSAELDGNSLYDSLEQVNIVEAIAHAALEAEL